MLKWEPHPYLKPPSDEWMASLDPSKDEDCQKLIDLHRIYHEAIENERRDPLRYGLVLPHWKDALGLLEEDNATELWMYGGNRSSKSKFCAWLCMRALLENPGTRIFCWSQNDEASKLNQQPYFWEYLPQEMRRKQRGTLAKIVYTKANGFTDKNFILPNGSQCIFKTYSQFLNDPTTIEGAELGAQRPADGFPFPNIGNWFDEYLLGPDLLETIRFRLATRDAVNLISFTPIDGYTEVVRQCIAGAKTLQTKEAKLLNGELVPYIQQPKKKNARIIYFHSEMNPYGGYERLARDLEGEPREKILVRAYGVPTKSATGKFPRFTRESNVMKHAELPFIKDPDYPVTRYLVVDPAPVKPWSMIWVAVDAAGVHYVYREWPDISYGEWGEWGKNNRSRPGPAAKANGYGIKDYVNLILTAEEGEEIYERYMDPRMGNTARQGKDGAVTMMDDMADEGMDFYPAPGKDEDEGLQALQNLIAWDRERPVDALNRTHFIVSDQCEQTILCLNEYTGNEGKNEAWKDFVDGCRYMAISGLEYVDTKRVILAKTGGY